MKSNLKLTVLFLVLFVLISCDKEPVKTNKIDGLWVVDKVLVDGGDLTPKSKWIKFNSDSTQSSGNGWLQHTLGTWSYNSSTKELATTNTFGVLDTAEPFTVSFQNEKMIWNRVEEGHPIEVILERAEKLPTSEANKLFGLWKFESIVENGKEISDSLNPSKKAMLFLRWDNTFELRNYPKGEQYGVFKTHAHRLQIDMLSYSKKSHNQYYTFSLNGDELLFTSTNSDKEIKLRRIHQFEN